MSRERAGGGGRAILHVDMDAFFASVEAREDPSLAGRPVVVGADPREGRGRGVVAAASYEARAYGIRSAMPISEAWRRCPRAVYLRPRLALYEEVSRRILAILRRFTDLVEPLSLDEAFLDVTASRALFGDGPEIARAIRREVGEREGLTASVGAAGSKFAAKLASDLEKPDGLVVVPPGGEREFLAPLGVERLWGAGPRAQERLRALGAATIGDVAALGEDRLVRAFGPALGRRFHRLARGLDRRPVVADRPRKSLGRETTFPRDVADRRVVEDALLSLADGLGRRLRRAGLAGAAVTVKLRFEGFETVTRQTTLPRAVDMTDEIWPVARRLLRAADGAAGERAGEGAGTGGRRIRLVGVSVTDLRPAGERQLSLFHEGRPPPGERVVRAVDRLAERFGEGVVTRAIFLRKPRPRYPESEIASVGAPLEGDAPMSHVPTREEALVIVHQYTESRNLRRHMYAVEAAMRDYAERFGEHPELWGITGLLHDFDYERWPNESREPENGHPSTGVAILRERGVSEEICRAILSHAEYTGVEPETRMEKALRAVDDLTGFIVACALVRPGGVLDLKPKSVKKKMKDRSFAAAVDREAIREAVRELGVELDEHIDLVIGSMRRIAGELGLEGKRG